ncbi:MAG TPA: hypothetical protein VFA85_09440 [Terriglobales bacterium]|nr:hypothetical protein [Terriglobales bacterium]
MTLARPLLLALLLAGISSAAMAADNTTSPPSSDSLQSVITQAVEQPSGLIYSVAKVRREGEPSMTDAPLAKLDDGVCFTMRMYKLKRGERFSDEESGRRGYTTCEMASNYQYRSAVAHAREGRDLPDDVPGK